MSRGERTHASEPSLFAAAATDDWVAGILDLAVETIRAAMWGYHRYASVLRDVCPKIMRRGCVVTMQALRLL